MLADTPRTVQKLWAENWAGASLETQDQRDKKVILQKWEIYQYIENRHLGRAEQPQLPDLVWVIPGNTLSTAKTLELYKNLQKAESTLLVQIYIGKIGLAQFLHSRHVPSYPTANCLCSGGHKTPRHIALYCTQERHRQHELKDSAGRTQVYPVLTGTKEGLKVFVRWIMLSGRLNQFLLASRLLYSGKQTAVRLLFQELQATNQNRIRKVQQQVFSPTRQLARFSYKQIARISVQPQAQSE